MSVAMLIRMVPPGWAAAGAGSAPAQRARPARDTPLAPARRRRSRRERGRPLDSRTVWTRRMSDMMDPPTARRGPARVAGDGTVGLIGPRRRAGAGPAPRAGPRPGR